ncbi:MAG: DUF1573 domain-containing protein [Bacteroidales bacterium]|nr:DUF1573 domain-containing protein [Bacteroidales bacterium]
MKTLIYTILLLLSFATGVFSPLAKKKADAPWEKTPAANEGSVSWDKTVHNFGDVSVSDGPLSCTFTLTNNGSEPISIFEVVSSCGCTDVKWTKGSIKPGETGTISATYKNEDGAMAFDKTLTAYISGVKKPVILRLRGVVHEKKKSLAQLYGAQKLGTFGMKTRTFLAGTLKQGLSTSETETVANLGTKPLKVTFADVSEGLSISVKSNPIPANSTATLAFTVTSAPDVYGKKIYRATPVLDGKKADAPLEITAWTQENFAGWSDKQRKDAALPYFDQSTFSIGSVKAGKVVEVTYTCTNRGKMPFHIFKADVEDPALQLKEMADVAPGKKGAIRFSLDTSKLPKGETVLMISLTTNSPLRPLINLFVAGIVE